MLNVGSLVITALLWVMELMELAILARVIISWIPIPRDGMFFRVLYQITEPILAPMRSIIERSELGRNMMVDFSPILAFLLIELIKNLIA